jgi:hypothetical protein
MISLISNRALLRAIALDAFVAVAGFAILGMPALFMGGVAA